MFRMFIQMRYLMITKRQKFVVTTILLTLGFTSINFLEQHQRFWGIGLLAAFSIVLFIWSLRESLGKNATLLTLTLPAFFTLAVGLFWFLLPSSIFARVPILIVYAAGVYSLSLTANILTVSTIRTIALSRAAKSVGFVLTLLTLFLLYDVILSFRASVLVSSLAIGASSFPLFLQGLWSSKLQTAVSKELIIYSFLFTYVISAIYAQLCFWPISVATGSIFLTSVSYVTLGLGQSKLEERLFKQTVREYLIVGILVFLTMFFVTSWRA